MTAGALKSGEKDRDREREKGREEKKRLFTFISKQKSIFEYVNI